MANPSGDAGFEEDRSSFTDSTPGPSLPPLSASEASLVPVLPPTNPPPLFHSEKSGCGPEVDAPVADADNSGVHGSPPTVNELNLDMMGVDSLHSAASRRTRVATPPKAALSGDAAWPTASGTAEAAVTAAVEAAIAAKLDIEALSKSLVAKLRPALLGVVQDALRSVMQRLDAPPLFDDVPPILSPTFGWSSAASRGSTPTPTSPFFGGGTPSSGHNLSPVPAASSSGSGGAQDAGAGASNSGAHASSPSGGAPGGSSSGVLITALATGGSSPRSTGGRGKVNPKSPRNSLLPPVAPSDKQPQQGQGEVRRFMSRNAPPPTDAPRRSFNSNDGHGWRNLSLPHIFPTVGNRISNGGSSKARGKKDDDVHDISHDENAADLPVDPSFPSQRGGISPGGSEEPPQSNCRPTDSQSVASSGSDRSADMRLRSIRDLHDGVASRILQESGLRRTFGGSGNGGARQGRSKKQKAPKKSGFLNRETHSASFRDGQPAPAGSLADMDGIVPAGGERYTDNAVKPFGDRRTFPWNREAQPSSKGGDPATANASPNQSPRPSGPARQTSGASARPHSMGATSSVNSKASSKGVRLRWRQDELAEDLKKGGGAGPGAGGGAGALYPTFNHLDPSDMGISRSVSSRVGGLEERESGQSGLFTNNNSPADDFSPMSIASNRQPSPFFGDTSVPGASDGSEKLRPVRRFSDPMRPCHSGDVNVAEDGAGRHSHGGGIVATSASDGAISCRSLISTARARALIQRAGGDGSTLALPSPTAGSSHARPSRAQVAPQTESGGSDTWMMLSPSGRFRSKTIDSDLYQSELASLANESDVGISKTQSRRRGSHRLLTNSQVMEHRVNELVDVIPSEFNHDCRSENDEEVVRSLVDRVLIICFKLGGVLCWNNARPWTSFTYKCWVVFLMAASLTWTAVEVVFDRAGLSISHASHSRGNWSDQRLITEVLMSGAAMSAILVMGFLKGRQRLDDFVVVLESYAYQHDLSQLWQKYSKKDAMSTLCLLLLSWCCAAAKIWRRTVELGESAPPTDVLVLEGLNMWVSAILMFVITFLTYILRILVVTVDVFCYQVVTNPDIPEATESWNTLQALLRKASSTVELGILVLLAVAAFMVPAIMVDEVALNYSYITYIWLMMPHMFVLIGVLRVFALAAAVTDKCVRVPALINSMSFGPGMEKERHSLVEYIVHSAAGFYLCDVRLTIGMVVKFMYVWGLIFFGFVSRQYTQD